MLLKSTRCSSCAATSALVALIFLLISLACIRREARGGGGVRTLQCRWSLGQTGMEQQQVRRQMGHTHRPPHCPLPNTPNMSGYYSVNRLPTAQGAIPMSNPQQHTSQHSQATPHAQRPPHAHRPAPLIPAARRRSDEDRARGSSKWIEQGEGSSKGIEIEGLPAQHPPPGMPVRPSAQKVVCTFRDPSLGAHGASCSLHAQKHAPF